MRKPKKGQSLAEKFPEVAAQWHPTKNGELTAYDVTSGSGKMVWWVCQRNHTYNMVVYDRKRKRNCPFCSGNKVSLYNCLSTTHPNIAKEWHPTKNGKLTPKDVTAGSGKRVWWVCRINKNHNWIAPVLDRKQGQGCGLCASKIVNITNCLSTTHQELAKEWHPTKNDGLTPKDVTSGSKKMVWWLCPKCTISYKTIISNRGKKNTACKSCAESGYDTNKLAYFYIREIILENKKAIKIGITNQLNKNREAQQKRKIKSLISFDTLYRSKPINGSLALKIEIHFKKLYKDQMGYLHKNEMEDGFTETIKHSSLIISSIKKEVEIIINDSSSF